MTLAPLTQTDLPNVLRFLAAREPQSMFLIANLAGQGHAMETWVARAGGHIAGIVGITSGGMILPQWPEGDWQDLARWLSGRPVEGLLGPADQVAALRPALGLAACPTRHDRIEPGYRLDLADLCLPDCADHALRPITDPAEVEQWRADYEMELFGAPPEEARRQARATVDRWQQADSHRVLWHQDRPVALSGFNARLAEVAQVGGVFVPPAFRGQGYARRAVGLHLAEARSKGLRRAVLFAASAPAARAYAALGFQGAGKMGLVLFAPGERVRAPDAIEETCR